MTDQSFPESHAFSWMNDLSFALFFAVKLQLHGQFNRIHLKCFKGYYILYKQMYNSPTPLHVRIQSQV